MRRFFAARWEGDRAYIAAEEAQHIGRVLRMRPGDSLIVLDQADECVCVIESIGPEAVTARLVERRPCPGEPRVSLTLYAAYMKADKMEWIVQKAVELGAGKIAPFVCERCVKIPKDSSRAQARLNRIAREAVKQCGRARVAEVDEPCSWQAMLAALARHDKALFAYECATGSLRDALADAGGDVALVVGPEGGFTPEEAAEAVGAGAVPVSLGRRILRGETAAVALTAIAAYETGC